MHHPHQIAAIRLWPRRKRPTLAPGLQHGFTLIELLVVIAIIGVLTGIAFPIYGAVRKKADQANCISNLKQMAAATMLCAQDNAGAYPNLHGYTWEPGAVWIADGLAPYVGGTVNRDPTKLLRCPAAIKNQQEAWLQDSLYCSYRYNIYITTPNRQPLVGFVNAMVFFDTTYLDWTSTQYAHFPGGGAVVNVGYADGHVGALAYNDYKALNQNGDESKNDFFTLGWIK